MFRMNFSISWHRLFLRLFVCVLLAGIRKGAHVEECPLGQVIALAVHNGGKALDGLCQRDVHTSGR